MAGTG